MLLVNLNPLPPKMSHLCIVNHGNKSAWQTSGGFPNSFEFLYRKIHPVNKYELRRGVVGARARVRVCVCNVADFMSVAQIRDNWGGGVQ